MDKKTISVYNETAKKIASLHSLLTPSSIYELIDSYFIKRSFCADIGCGIGRDTHWLIQQGYKAVGVDASIGMLIEAQQHYPKVHFINDSLPLLGSISDEYFDNVLCSAVIMHLDISDIELSTFHLTRIIRQNGVIIISFRGTKNTDGREDGKLYTPISSEKLISAFSNHRSTLLHYSTQYETKRKLTWHNMVFKKQAHLEA